MSRPPKIDNNREQTFFNFIRNQTDPVPSQSPSTTKYFLQKNSFTDLFRKVSSPALFSNDKLIIRIEKIGTDYCYVLKSKDPANFASQVVLCKYDKNRPPKITPDLIIFETEDERNFIIVQTKENAEYVNKREMLLTNIKSELTKIINRPYKINISISKQLDMLHLVCQVEINYLEAPALPEDLVEKKRRDGEYEANRMPILRPSGRELSLVDEATVKSLDNLARGTIESILREKKPRVEIIFSRDNSFSTDKNKQYIVTTIGKMLRGLWLRGIEDVNFGLLEYTPFRSTRIVRELAKMDINSVASFFTSFFESAPIVGDAPIGDGLTASSKLFTKAESFKAILSYTDGEGMMEDDRQLDATLPQLRKKYPVRIYTNDELVNFGNRSILFKDKEPPESLDQAVAETIIALIEDREKFLIQGKTDKESLLPLLKSSEHDIRLAAATALTKMGYPEGLKTLLDFLAYGNEYVKFQVACTLSTNSEYSSEAIRVLTELMWMAGNGALKAMAAFELARLGNERGLRQLVFLCLKRHDFSENKRIEWAKTLIELGHLNEGLEIIEDIALTEARPKVDMTYGKANDYRYDAIRLLGKYKNPRSIPALKKLAEEAMVYPRKLFCRTETDDKIRELARDILFKKFGIRGSELKEKYGSDWCIYNSLGIEMPSSPTYR